MNLSPYSEYKPSGVEWLGDLPAHWKVLRLTRVLNFIRNGASDTQVFEGDNTVPVTRIETISKGVVDFNRVGYVDWHPALEFFRLQRGDILLSHINSLSMIGNCAFYNQDRPLYSGMNLLRLNTVEGLESRWLWRLMSSEGFRCEISSYAKPAVNQASVTTMQIRMLKVPLPSLSEQTAIADFLDRETEKIDALVAKKRTLIERLKEERTALITHTVTRGLPPETTHAAGLEPHPKLKPSGVEWLGEVPEHWEVKRSRFCADVNPQSFRSLHPDSEASFVPMEAVGEYGGLNLDQTRYVFEVNSGYTEFKDGDVVVAKITPCFENGKGALATGLLNGIGFGTTELHVLRPFENLDVRFLFYFSISQVFRNMGAGEMYGAGDRNGCRRNSARIFKFRYPLLKNNAPSPISSTARPRRSTRWRQKSRPLSNACKSTVPPSSLPP